mmetsp:Transcript_7257/g.14388  ORF Transcript_7257/g.14388 Transcript_7257/m.14388 type:complete len:114 (+) Transcript_7257:1-342(+)
MVSDRDGVTILSTLVPASPSGHDSPTPTSGAASRSIPIEAGFAVIADQISKLQLGKCQHLVVVYDGKVVVHVNLPPLVISLIADDVSEIEAIISIAPQLQAALSPLQKVLSAA